MLLLCTCLSEQDTSSHPQTSLPCHTVKCNTIATFTFDVCGYCAQLTENISPKTLTLFTGI